MTRVKRGGRELVVEEANVAEYLKAGYSVIDANGNVVDKPAIESLTLDEALTRLAYAQERVKRLTERVSELERMIDRPVEKRARKANKAE